MVKDKDIKVLLGFVDLERFFLEVVIGEGGRVRRKVVN